MAGVLDASRVLSAQASSGQFLTFTVLTGIIVGGTSILGGEGTDRPDGPRLPVRRAHRQRVQPARASTRSTSRSPSVSSCCWRSASTPGHAGSSEPPRELTRESHALRRPTSTGPSPTPGARQRRLVRRWRGCASSARTRAPSTRTSPSAVIQPGGWLAPHVHAFEEALYVLEGELLLDLAGTRPSPGRRRLRPDADRAAPRARQHSDAPIRCARSRSTRRSGSDPDGRSRHVLRAGPGSRGRWTRPRPVRRSATRRSGSSATTTGTPPQLETLRIKDAATRPRAGRHRHRVLASTAASR